ncbi:MAG: 23S rRNA (adenine(2503)-C(2))-methyltransferase RlmN, partial [Candidatus Marinimicrobia bacterium]|nr:23S rRNA (adenine(2503)-C(2))-methyltransferase RlmN [Candidatus Neomarinimicrobiota bacterium]
MKKNKIRSIKDLNQEELKKWIVENKYPKFRSKQIYNWIYKQFVDSPFEMKNIPKKIRENIDNYGNFNLLELDNPNEIIVNSSKKYLFKLIDGYFIESVLILENNRVTICVSSQVGCGLKCGFCQTGKMGFLRNLTVGEIVDQILFIRKDINKPITNVVYMGMGEPFLNYDNVIKSAIIINDNAGLNIGARKITISTSGIVPEIYKFADINYQFKLAISLNVPTDEKRDKIMPINKKYNLNKLIEALKYYNFKTNKKITIEYVLMKDVNDFEQDAKDLINLLKNIHCKINLIPFNENETEFSRPNREKINKFHKLIEKRIDSTIRWSKGEES